MIKHPFYWERRYASKGYDFVIGVDEAGRGPLAGPVVACAVALKEYEKLKNTCHCEGSRLAKRERPRQFCILNSRLFPASPAGRQNSKSFHLIRDSKTLSEKQRESLYDFILKHFHIGIGICDHKTIDRINILEATYLAMKKAMTSLKKEISNDQISISNKIPNPKSQNSKYFIHNTLYMILVDGNKPIPNCSYNQRAIVNGDKLVKSISAASIVAKVTRDRIMRQMSEVYPVYNFAQHKGYGTKMHREMIKKHGPCPIHRASFEPLKSWTKRGKG